MPNNYNTQDQQIQDADVTGNRCGHDPKSPRWFEPPADHAPRPPILTKWIGRVRQFYTDPSIKIPSLAHVLFGRKQAADPEGDHHPRKMRSERREACCSLLGAIAHYCDLPSLCLSVPQPDGSLLPVRMDTLAERAGLTLRRAERAMRDIVEAGLLAVYPRCELQDDGTYIGHAAIRVVTPSFFGLFGLEARLEHDRRRISQKRTKERADRLPTRTEGARIKTAIGAVVNKLTGKGKPAKPKVPNTDAAQIPEPPALDAPHKSHIRDLKSILSGEPQPRGPAQTNVGADQARGDEAGAADPAVVQTCNGNRDPP